MKRTIKGSGLITTLFVGLHNDFHDNPLIRIHSFANLSVNMTQ